MEDGWGWTGEKEETRSTEGELPWQWVRLGVGRAERGEGEMEERVCWINLHGAIIWFT